MAFLAFSFKRLRSKAALSVLYLASLVFIVAIVVAVPVFSDGAGRTIVERELAARTERLRRPPFCLRFYGMPTSRFPMSLEEANYVRDWMANSLTRRVGLPVAETYSQYESPSFQLRAKPGDAHYSDGDLFSIRIACVPGIEDRVRITDGAAFGVASASDELGVWVATSFAQELGLQVEDVFDVVYLLGRGGSPVGVRIKGFFEQADPSDRYWYGEASTMFRGALLTTFEQYQTHIAPLVPQGTGFNSWYYVLDDARMNLDHVDRYVGGVQSVEREFERRVPNGKMDFAPTEELLRGQARKKALTTIMFSFSVPLLCILTLFMACISSIVARFQTQETAMLLSRGSSRWQIMRWAAQEAIFLFLLALGPGILFGSLLAGFLGKSEGFLSFVSRAPVEIRLRTARWSLVVLVGILSTFARVLSSWPGNRLTVVTYEQKSSRTRAALSGIRLSGILLLSATAAYAYRQLEQSGTLFIGAWQPEGSAVLDPLALLAPSIFLFTAPIVATELFSVIMRILSLFLRPVRLVSAYLGFLHLGREGGQFRMPMYSLVLTLTVGIFYASIAKSAGIWMVERRRYEVGADLTFQPVSTWGADLGAGGSLGGDAFVLPSEEYEKVDGVYGATSVAEFVARVPLPNYKRRLRLLAIEYSDFPQIAFYRNDFSRHSLGELMLFLASRRDGVLVPSNLPSQLHLNDLSRIPLRIRVAEQTITLDFEIVGTYDYFPTMFEDEEPVVVVSLPHLEQQTGGFFPRRVWIRLRPGASAAAVLQGMESLWIEPTQVGNVQELIARDRARSERIGIFGMLSVCFLSAALFSAIGHIVYSFASILGRSRRFAVMRAIGMSKRQVSAMVSVEDFMTIIYGLTVGLGLGLLSSYLYVPFYALTERPVLPVPPFLPHIDWQSAINIGVTMGIVLLVTQVSIMLHVRKTRIFEALRMGTRP